MSTIFALSSGTGRAGVAVIRASGPASASLIQSLAGALPDPRRASFRRLRTKEGETLDRGLVLWFPGPNSFTGEDCAEFHVHGSRAVVSAVLAELACFPDCSPAEAGDFARRAFLHGRADLIELEALGDLLAAETEAQRRMAIRHGEGELRRRVGRWSDRLSELLAEAEADLDFSDEEDVGVDLSKARTSALVLARDIRMALASAARSDLMRDGFKVVIIGPPNAGKSSLLNQLAGHDAAIVSELPGTTRDTISVRLDLDGMPVTVTDTAGLRASEDPIEKIGVERAGNAAAQADLVLWLSMHEPPAKAFSVDLAIASQRDRFGADPLPVWADFGISINQQDTVNAILSEIRRRAEQTLRSEAELMLNVRQRIRVETAAARCFSAAICEEPELFAEELRLARLELARLTGSVAASDVLDLLFGKFCIGK